MVLHALAHVGQAQWIESLVLTEEDSLDFLIAAAENSQRQSHFLRPDIRPAMAGYFAARNSRCASQTVITRAHERINGT